MSAVLLAALVWQVIDFLKELTDFKQSKSAVITQLAAWLAGIGVVMLGAHAAVAHSVVIPGFSTPIGQLDGGSQVVVGLLVASIASSAVDLKQAFDNGDTAAKPPLLDS